MREILNTIKNYDTIIIHRHSRPDMDAIGSQVGLKLTLKEMFPEKKIYAVGDVNNMSYQAVMDDVSDKMYQDALAIITDVSVSKMISDDRYVFAKDRIIIDHHTNDTDVDNVLIFYRDDSYSSACEMIIDMFRQENIAIPQESATYLYGGMVTDSGRFMYLKEAERTFALASYVAKFKPNISHFYDYLYTETLERRMLKNKFQHFEQTEAHVAYRITSYQEIRNSGVDFQAISRGMVNLMAGIKEIPIWGSFCQDESGNYIAELRSRHIPIVDVAKKYGGGGHLNACGATLSSLDEVYHMLQDLDQEKQKYEQEGK